MMKVSKAGFNFVVIALSLFLITPIASAYHGHSENFPIGIFWNPGPAEASDAKFAEIADMNTNFIVSTNFTDTFEENDAMLDYAADNDLQVLVSDGRLVFNDSQEAAQTAGGGVLPVSSAASVGQTITSLKPAWSTVQLRTAPGGLPAGVTLTLSMYSDAAKNGKIMSDSITGPVSGEQLNFDFYTTIAENHPYYIELTSNSATPVQIVVSTANVYAGGQAYASGISQPGADLWFKAMFSTRAYFDGQAPADATIDEIAQHYKNHPALMGYNLIDEPGAGAYPMLKHVADRFKANDPGHMSFVNLLPIYSDPTQNFETITNYTGDFVSSSNPLGQTFKTKANETLIRYISLYIDHSTWSSGEQLTLSLWNSPAKQTLIASKTLNGASTIWIPFELNAAVSPNTSYYWELTHNGGGDDSVGWVVRSNPGNDWYPDGNAYINGQPVANSDFRYAVNQGVLAQAYEEYVNRWVNQHPDVLVFDHYPFRVDGERSSYYENLEIIRRQALQGQVDFWSYIQSVGIQNDLVAPTENQIRYQVYTNLAYGAKGLIYFTYQTPPADWGFHDGLILPDGTKNASYYGVKNINAEVMNLGCYLQSLTSQAVYHTGTIPEGATALPNDFFIRPADSSQPLVISYFKDENGKKYVFIVNRDTANSRTVTFQVNPKPGQIKEISKATGKKINANYNKQAGTLTASFAAGEGRLFLMAGN
ncbi:hypothetical protein [Paenibacillus sp. GCM10027626]|uniref:hypothetical protein n=1 Tax=Paenibacillus sp. GCM10027626 TaxID=3273411 RepID=UPI0036360F89